MIKVNHLHKAYGGNTVLRDISVTINPGEVVAVIGPSGTGKSTFLRCLNRLEHPDGGSVSIAGVDVTSAAVDIAAVRQKMNMVFQGFYLFDHLNVIDNLTLAPVTLGLMNQTDATLRARELLAQVGMAGFENHRATQLSGGQKQRVAIARCLAMDPDVLLLDEPTSALDPRNVGEVLSVLKRLAQAGMTMIIVTHELEFAKDVASRVFFMSDGDIYEDATPAHIFGDAARQKTREFIKQANSLCFDTALATPDIHGLYGAIDDFCLRQNLDRSRAHNLQLISEELLLILSQDNADTTDHLQLAIDFIGQRDRLEMVVSLPEFVSNPLESKPDTELGLLLIENLSQSVDFRQVQGQVSIHIVL